MSWGDAEFDAVDQPVASLRPPRPAFSAGSRTALVYAGVILPILCFTMTASGPIDTPSWQSGQINDYFAFLLTGRAGYVFYPLLIYSMVSFCIALFDVRQYADTIVVQLGVYSGVILALHFSVVLYIVSLHIASPGAELLGLPIVMAIAILIPVIVGYGFRATLYLLRFATESSSVAVFGVFVGIVVLFLTALAFASAEYRESIGGLCCLPIGLFIAASLFGNAYWAFGAYLAVAIRLARRNWRRMQFRLSQLLIVFTWLAAYLAACRASVTIALAEYAKLPTSPPSNCYIATAAARGHRHFVGAREISLGTGQAMWVNRQLVTLKCGELAIRAIFPRLHRGMRLVYDWLGPRLASRMTHPLIADMVYLSLKPCEWATRLALGLLLKNNSTIAGDIYPVPEGRQCDSLGREPQVLGPHADLQAPVGATQAASVSPLPGLRSDLGVSKSWG